MEIYEYLRRRIREMRLRKGLDGKALALAAGLPPSTYSSIETGKQRLTVDTLHRILVALNAEIVEVWPARGAQTDASFTWLNALRFREMWLHSGAQAACLLFQRGRALEVLASINVSKEDLDRLRPEQADSLDREWRWLRHSIGSSAVYLGLKDAQTIEVVEPLARLYLQIWFTNAMADPRGGDVAGEGLHANP